MNLAGCLTRTLKLPETSSAKPGFYLRLNIVTATTMMPGVDRTMPAPQPPMFPTPAPLPPQPMTGPPLYPPAGMPPQMTAPYPPQGPPPREYHCF